MTDLPSHLAEKRAVYLKGIKDHQEEDGQGFLLVEGGDSLFYTCLARLGGVTGIRIRDARRRSGQWLRRPTRLPEAYAAGDSGSTLSRDPLITMMLLSLLDPFAGAEVWRGIWLEFWDYLMDHETIPYLAYRFGEGDSSRIYTTPPLMASLVMVLRRLGHKPSASMRRHEDLVEPFEKLEFVSGMEGSGRHLQVLHCLVRRLARGSPTATEHDRLEEAAKDDRRNALFQIAAHHRGGNIAKAIDTLSDVDLFPARRLPRVSDRKHQYLWLRGAKSGDWKPGEKRTEHPGIDFLVAAALLERLS
jgi:hypothetical protein